jgi:hypothetical protein
MTNAYVTRNGLDILIGARLDRIRSRRILVRHVHVSSCYFMLFHGPVEKKHRTWHVTTTNIIFSEICIIAGISVRTYGYLSSKPVWTSMARKNETVKNQ